MPGIKPLEQVAQSELEPLIRASEQTLGFVPNSMLTMARWPALMHAFGQLAMTVLGPGLLSPELKHLAAHIASTAAGCRYCQAHTGGNVLKAGVAPEKLAQAWDYETSEAFTAAERAALRLAHYAAVVPNATTLAHFDELKQHFTEAQIVELVAVISLFGFLNRWNDTMATELEEPPLAFGQQHLSARGWEAGKHQTGETTR